MCGYAIFSSNSNVRAVDERPRGIRRTGKKKGFRSIGNSFSKIFKGEAVYHVRPDARYQRPGTVKRVGRR